jgi:chromosome partitioning protein
MAIVSAANLKGGVGKTSTVVHAAGTLAQLGKRVLIVDNDPQASATAGFLGAQAARQLDPAATVAAIHSGDDPFPERVIRPAGFDRIDLLPGSRFAADFNTPAAHKAPYEEQVRLREFLAGVSDRYDLVLIDNPPNLHLATWSSLAASDYYLVPVQPEDFGSQGTVDVVESADRVRARINPGLTLLGFVVTMYSARRAVHRLYEEQLRSTYAELVFAAAVPESIDYIEAIAARRPVALHKPRGAAAKAIRAVVEELLGRMDRAEAERAGEAA